MSSELLTLREAAFEYGITPSRMTRLVRRTRMPTQPNPADRRSKLVRRRDVELSLRRDLPSQAPDELQNLREVEIDWPPAGSSERRTLTLEALERIWRGTEELRRSGRKFSPTTEALDIVRGARD
jgi:hypothetical protein